MKRTLKERRTTEAPHDNEMKRAKARDRLDAAGFAAYLGVGRTLSERSR